MRSRVETVFIFLFNYYFKFLVIHILGLLRFIEWYSNLGALLFFHVWTFSSLEKGMYKGKGKSIHSIVLLVQKYKKL